MSTTTCRYGNDHRYFCSKCNADRVAAERLALKVEVESLKRRVRLARRQLDARVEPESRYFALRELLDLRKPLPRGRR